MHIRQHSEFVRTDTIYIYIIIVEPFEDSWQTLAQSSSNILRTAHCRSFQLLYIKSVNYKRVLFILVRHKIRDAGNYHLQNTEPHAGIQMNRNEFFCPLILTIAYRQRIDAVFQIINTAKNARLVNEIFILQHIAAFVWTSQIKTEKLPTAFGIPCSVCIY